MRIAFSVFKALTRSSVRRFETALAAPEAAQKQVLTELAKMVAKTEYGKNYGVESRSDFREKLPLVEYGALQPWVERQKASAARVLTAEPPKFYEKTSGSSGPAKYIPYTKALQKSFSRMFGLWAHDVLENGPDLHSAKLFFSISPFFGEPEMTEAGTQVGLDDDSDYVSGWMNWFLKPFLAVPPSLSSLKDPEVFKRELVRALTKARELEVISVWNPSFLTMIVSYMRDNSTELGLASDFEPKDVWPNLKLISCWASASAAPLAERLKEEFPGVLIQGKGLLATEAPITMPWIPAQGFVPLLDEVFLEFETQEGEMLLLHELQEDEIYRVVVSQKGGLCRYRMGDLVKVTGFYHQTPCLDFVGRADAVSDLVGEKLSEIFVHETLQSLRDHLPDFATLVPVRKPHDHYVLLVSDTTTCVEELESLLESRLGQAHHYQHARHLGQLGPCRVVVAENASDLFMEEEQRRGLKLGDIKPRSLYHQMPSEALIEVLQ